MIWQAMIRRLATFVFKIGWCTSRWITAVYILTGLGYDALTFEDSPKPI